MLNATRDAESTGRPVERAEQICHCPTLRPHAVQRLIGRLQVCSVSEQRTFLRRRLRWGHQQLAQHLIADTDLHLEREPRHAVQSAELAVRIARWSPATANQQALATDLRVEAWANLANALRVAGDFARAELAWRWADALRKHGTHDEHLEADCFHLQGLLHQAQGQLVEARHLVTQAVRLYRCLGDRHFEGRARIVLAEILGRSGHAREAHLEASAALQLLDPSREPETYFRTLHALVAYLMDLRFLQPAVFLFLEIEPHYHRFGDEIFQLRGRWLKGKLLSALRLWNDAEECLEQVRRGFQARSFDFDAALAGLDLALVYSAQRRFHRVELLAQEMYAVLVSRQIPREASTFLSLLAEAAQRCRVTQTLLTQTLQALAAIRQRHGR